MPDIELKSATPQLITPSSELEARWQSLLTPAFLAGVQGTIKQWTEQRPILRNLNQDVRHMATHIFNETEEAWTEAELGDQMGLATELLDVVWLASSLANLQGLELDQEKIAARVNGRRPYFEELGDIAGNLVEDKDFKSKLTTDLEWLLVQTWSAYKHLVPTVEPGQSFNQILEENLAHYPEVVFGDDLPQDFIRALPDVLPQALVPPVLEVLATLPHDRLNLETSQAAFDRIYPVFKSLRKSVEAQQGRLLQPEDWTPYLGLLLRDQPAEEKIPVLVQSLSERYNEN